MNTLLQLTTSVEHSHLIVPRAETQTETPNLQSQVVRVTNAIEDPALRTAVERILGDLIFMLDWLSLVGEDHSPSDEIDNAVSLLRVVGVEARSLVSFIEDNALRLEGLNEGIKENLDSMAYAIGHELRQLFESETARSKFDAPPNQDLRGPLIHARGVLRNCFQHCVINLVRVFDQNLTGAQLYDDWSVRRQRSLILCRELAALIEVVQASEFEPHRIAKKLISFRDGSMRWLMHKDWQDYESLSGQVIANLDQGNRPADLLHRLSCYLETLLTQVKGRTILRVDASSIE
jgi:hypothetical protein